MGAINILNNTAEEINKMRISNKEIDHTLIYKLFEIGILSKETAKKFLVKKHYFDMLNDDPECSCKSALLETAKKFEVNEAFVSNVIYYHHELKVF